MSAFDRASGCEGFQPAIVRSSPPFGLMGLRALAGRPGQVNITLPEELLATVDRYPTRTGFSRSGLLAQAVRERMRRDRDAA